MEELNFIYWNRFSGGDGVVLCNDEALQRFDKMHRLGLLANYIVFPVTLEDEDVRGDVNGDGLNDFSATKYALVLARKYVELQDTENLPFHAAVAQFKYSYIKKRLYQARGVVSESARLLGTNRKTVYRYFMPQEIKRIQGMF